MPTYAPVFTPPLVKLTLMFCANRPAFIGIPFPCPFPTTIHRANINRFVRHIQWRTIHDNATCPKATHRAYSDDRPPGTSEVGVNHLPFRHRSPPAFRANTALMAPGYRFVRQPAADRQARPLEVITTPLIGSINLLNHVLSHALKSFRTPCICSCVRSVQLPTPDSP